MSAPVPSGSVPDSNASAVPDAPRRQPTAPPPADREETKKRVIAALRYFPDWPTPGVNFIDILPIFQDPKIFDSLLQVLELQIRDSFDSLPDVIVGLDARGFPLRPPVGPAPQLLLRAEYGEDFFQMQVDAIKPGQKVLVVDDIIATGGSAAAAGSLVSQLGGSLMGYLFLIEISFLAGRAKLGDVPILTLVEEK
ncbi:adenine phosphoribosyltransferase [Apiospora hydei]|uniref:adenine phosphoribosyltransferase n=1 Tax=Apiospora hydei TaxID=1337664 RepID=A0ABR1VUB9_9PEZI